MMNYFGCRDDFAIEVGDQLDHTGHCQLDFYAKGIHLNRVDNQAYLNTAVPHWPEWWFWTEEWHAADIYWEVPFSTSPLDLLRKVMTEREYFHRHRGFDIGPVADSFTLLGFGRPTDFVLLIIRNDDWSDGDDHDLPAWNVLPLPDTDEPPIHWLSLTLPRQEFKHICTSAHACLAELHAKIPPVIYLMREERLVYDAISTEGCHFNDVVAATGLSAETVSSKLVPLEMRGLIRVLPGKKCVRVPDHKEG